MKEETYVVAMRYRVPVALVANSPLGVPRGLGVELVLVDRGPDAADDWIAEHVRPGDVVVTSDIPLPARCLEAGARVLGTTGRVFSEDSIGDRLATRELRSYLREAGVSSGGVPGPDEPHGRGCSTDCRVPSWARSTATRWRAVWCWRSRPTTASAPRATPASA